MCEKITEHIWSPVDPDPKLLMSITENGPPVFRQVISILEDDTVDKNFKYMIAQAECKLGPKYFVLIDRLSSDRL